MREKRPVWFCITVGLLLCSAGYAAYGLHGYDTERFWLSVVLLFVSAVLFLISFFLFSKRNIRFIATLNDELAAAEHETMYSLPVPTVILDDSGLILWYNLLFGRDILENDDVFGLRIGEVLDLDLPSLQSGKPAHVVVDRQTTLAGVLIDRMEAEDIHLTIDVPTALTQMTEQTLLIVVDTHSKDFVESVDLYQNARQVVVIDHHRKIVNFIDNAVIFYHEPYASSAAELVTELLQHFRNTEHLNPAYADVLLAGIMLDTKNFVMRTGVRTFEAAAYLRKMGADTIAVRQFFSSSIETYQHRAHLVSQAELYHHCAIAVADEVFNDIKLVAPQAADELLGIRSVAASFVLYSLNGEVNISARSMGSMNVQVVMEKLGGGGHQTMAATQIPDITVAEAKQQLLQVLAEEFAQPEQSK